MRVLITGSAGYLGSKIVELLARKGGCEIFGIDVCDPKNFSLYKYFAKGSVVDANLMSAIFERAKPDVALHLAFVVTSTHNKKYEEDVALKGAANFLNCCEKLKVPKAIFLSSVAAYGAHDDNDQPLTENSPIRGVEGYGYSYLKAETDKMAGEFMVSHQTCDFVILRPCLFVGPNTHNNFFDVLKFPIVPQVKDSKGVRDPEFQFIHEDDMAACVVAAIEKPVRGIFNVAADGRARFSELVKIFGKKSIAIPAWILYPVTALLWKLHLVTSPPAQLNFIRYQWIMDMTRMQRELFVPQRNGIEAFKEFAREK